MSQLLQELLCRITGGQLLWRLQRLPRRAKATKAKEGGYRIGLLCPVGCSVLERTAHANGGRLLLVQLVQGAQGGLICPDVPGRVWWCNVFVRYAL